MLTSGRLTEEEARDFQAVLDGSASRMLYERALLDLSSYLHHVHGEPVVILIDEYDEPIHAGHVNGYAKPILEFCRVFLTEGLEGNPHLFRAVLTGILRVARESIFSGLNNLAVSALLHESFSTCFGFTEAEVLALLEQAGRTSEAEVVRHWYDGYSFGRTVIYNPWSVLNFLHWQKPGDAARPYWVSTSSNDLVERPIYDQVVERLAKMAKEAVLGDPLDPRTMIGPIVSRGEYDKILGYIEDGKETAKLIAGGGTRTLDGKGLFIEPTLFADATNDMKIAREEISGPVLPVIPFEGEEEAIRLANDSPYGLAAGIQTGDMARAIRLGERINAGTVWLNTWHKYHPNAPFGGYKMSGYGRENCAETLESYTQYKTMWANL